MSGDAPPPASVPASADEAAVGAVLDNLRTFRHRYWAPILLGVIMLFDSWDSVAIAYVMPTMSSEWRLDALTMGFVISAGYGGQFLGAVFLGGLAERFGRMPVWNVSIVVMCVLGLACAVAPNYATMLPLRLLQGMAIGGALPISITYVNELAPTKTRGRYFAMFQLLCMAGYPAASIASTFIIPHFGWRWVLALGALPCLLLPLVWMTLPESPRWLARIGRTDRANKGLVKLGGAPAVLSGEANARTGPARPTGKRPNTLTLFSNDLRGRTTIVTLLWFLGLFTNFGLTTWAPSIYVKVFHFPLERALSYTAISTTTFLVLVMIAGTLIDKFGRRPFAIGGTFISATALLSLALFRPTEEFFVVGLVMTGQLAISTSTLILWPYTAETYPTSARALGLGYGSSIGRGASMLTPIFVGLMISKGAPIFLVFAAFGLCALGAFSVWAFKTRETAGKPLDTV